MNHVKYLRAGLAEMPFQNWYREIECLLYDNHQKGKMMIHRQYKSFQSDRFCQLQIQKPTGLRNKPSISHNLVRRIRTIKSPGTGFEISVLDDK